MNGINDPHAEYVHASCVSRQITCKIRLHIGVNVGSFSSKSHRIDLGLLLTAWIAILFKKT